jgi:hypothetical protein
MLYLVYKLTTDFSIAVEDVSAANVSILGGDIGHCEEQLVIIQLSLNFNIGFWSYTFDRENRVG